MERSADAIAPPRKLRLTRAGAMFIGWRIILLLIAVLAFDVGIKLRWRLYHDTAAIRFKGDISNGWNQGIGVYKDADAIRYFHLTGATTKTSARNIVSFPDYFSALRKRYDVLFSQAQRDDYGLDYPPARLLIMSSWVWFNRTHLTGRPPPPFDMDLAKPLLRLNTAMEALSALAIFMIIRRVLSLEGSRWAATSGLVGALLAWFSLAALLDGHIWPQWDNWPLPFYLWACWFALRCNWLTCGALLALGAMCKGQMMMAAPAILLWPLMGFQFRAALDVILGFAAATLLFVSPWFLNTSDATSTFYRLIPLVSMAVLIQRRFSFRLLLTAASVTLLFVGLRCGSVAWYFVGFAYGARHFESALHVGIIPNLGSILNDTFDFNAFDPIRNITEHYTLNTRNLLLWLNGIATILCGAALALQSRRGDRRILIALALPWLTAVCLLPQMHERYMLWAGVCTALLAGVSVGATLIHLMIALLAAMPIAAALFDQADRSQFSPAALVTLDQWRTAVHHAWPGDAWSMLTLMLILMYLVFTPSRRGLTYVLPVQR